MRYPHRIHTIYVKELIDILRDRRTLIAMIVVPIVLYPLLMLGSVQAVMFQGEAMMREEFLIGFTSDYDRIRLARMIDGDRVALEQQLAVLDPESEAAQSLPVPLDDAKSSVFEFREQLEEAIRGRLVQVGVIFEEQTLIGLPHYDRQVGVELLADAEEIRGYHAKRRVEGLLLRVRDRMVGARMAQERLPSAFIDPFPITTVDLSSPPSILGQILPLILILMTITGAIYPAIDLTAGERERGTLETLMVCPVPVIDLIVGKFLVVTTVAIMGATLNLASVTATVYFGGFGSLIASTGDEIPLGTMVFILLSLVPFAVLMSALMIAVCSYARTFKEAQNYVTPVILAVLIPGGIAAFPATRLDGIMLVMPVGNMVLLTRELLLGATVPIWHVVLVLLSTTLYAGAAVAIAASVFGKESVVFADAGSLRGVIRRKGIKPSEKPSVSMGVLLVSLLFPAWFFVQASLSPEGEESATGLLYNSGWLMPLLFVALPIAVMLYWKVKVSNGLSLRMPAARHIVAGVLFGVAAWVPAHELNVAQQWLMGTPHSVVESAMRLAETLATMPTGVVLLLIAFIPAVCEELLFRGFLLSALSSAAGRWTSILVAAAVFGVFHFFVFKFAVTAGLGIVLGLLCWQSRSILPGIVAHLIHNGLTTLMVLHPEWLHWLGLPGEAEAETESAVEWVHLPTHILILGGAIFLVGLFLASRSVKPAQNVGQVNDLPLP